MMFPFFFGFGLVLFWFVISVAMCLWVYQDAESQMNGILWLIIVLVAGPIGFIIYLIVRGERRIEPRPVYVRGRPRFCSNCGHEITSGS